MSYIDDLNQAASEALAASSSATNSAQIMSDVANGDETTTVTTANGEVKTLAKAIKDIIDSIEAGVEAPQVEPQTLSAGQTTVTLSTMTTEGIAVYVEGSREFDFTVVNSTDFEFGESFPDETRIWIVKRDIEGVADSFTVNTSTGSQTLAGALDARAISVGSVTEGFFGKAVIDGQQFTAAGRYPGGETGGALFVGRTGVQKSDHDGMTVISPTVPPVSAQPGTTQDERNTNFLAGNGETDPTGSGVFAIVRRQGGYQKSIDLRSKPSRVEYTPAFNKYAGNPVFSDTDVSTTTIYWPSVIRMEGLIANPVDNYYMYYSTDHGAGGIYLATAPTPFGPWTEYGLVYNDTVEGSSTETPSVIWKEETSELYLYYHNFGAGVEQSTGLAISTDGLTFTRFGIVLDIYSLGAFPGDGHTGYFRASRVNGLWFGHHLMGGTNYPHFGVSYSYDGQVWIIDKRPLGYSQDIAQDPAYRLEWSIGQVVEYAGRLWWIGFRSTFASGGAGASGTIVAAPISKDLRNIIGIPKTVVEATELWETSSIRAVSLLADKGNLYLYYQMGNNIGVASIGDSL